jgi:hypothetical protein
MKTADKQLALRVPSSLYDQIARSGNVSEEIRRRLETFSGDDKTQALQAAIGRVADTIGTFCAPWHEDRFAWEIMKAAVEALLAHHQPQGETPAEGLLGRITGTPRLFFGPDDDPATIGRGLALGELKR